MKKKIFKWLISDVDGILTDGGHYYTAEGKTLKCFGSNDKDALKQIASEFIDHIIFITADKNGFAITKKRIEDELGYELHLIDSDNREKFISSLKGRKLYLGDGIYDSELFGIVDFSMTLENSSPQAKKAASYILPTIAGQNVFSHVLYFLQNESKQRLPKMKNDVDIQNSGKDDFSLMIDEMNKLKEYKNEINRFCEKIAEVYDDDRKVVFCGVGKNALLSEMMCEFLHPYNVVSITLDPHRAVHGNLGVLGKDDILILTSKSGNTAELIYLMECLKNKMKIENKFIITSNKNAKLLSYDFKDALILANVKREIARFGHSPQTTILNYSVILFNLINKIAYKKKITENEYLANHQAGDVGKLFNRSKFTSVNEDLPV